MKIALIGASGSGKTVYFTGLFLRFRNVISLPNVSSTQRERFLAKGVTEKVGFRFKIDDPTLENLLSSRAMLLGAEPITVWPESTPLLDKPKICVSFDFLPLDGETAPRSYPDKIVEIYDPSGEAFRGGSLEPDKILRELEGCDVGLVFLSLDKLLTAIDLATQTVDEDKITVIMAEFALGKSVETLMAMEKKLAHDEFFPLCFVVSKADNVPSDKVEFVYQVLYDHIIKRFSLDNKKHLICVCPISVLNRKNNCFQAFNLEWPFLFAMGGSILRDGYKLRKSAESERVMAGVYDRNADRLEKLANGGFFEWLDYIFDRDNYHVERRIANRKRSDADKTDKRASENMKLARDIWQSIDTEGFESKVRIIANGKLIKAAEYA